MVQMAKFGPFPAPMSSETVQTHTKRIKNKFRYHLHKIKFALKCIPEAVPEVLLLLGVALKANVGNHPNHVFCHLLTTPDTQKVVPFVVEFL